MTCLQGLETPSSSILVQLALNFMNTHMSKTRILLLPRSRELEAAQSLWSHRANPRVIYETTSFQGPADSCI